MDEAPYKICCICGKVARVEHHEPPRSLIMRWFYDDPEIKHDMCRWCHTLGPKARHRMSYEKFKELHPDYTGMSITEYREMERIERKGKF